jgi:hypothetical protein
MSMRLAPLLATAMLLAGCALRPQPVALAPVVPPPPVVAIAMPTPPEGAAPNLVLPPRDAAGWATPNRGLSPAAAAWHLRAALNVAALGCRDAQEAETIAHYNALLATKRTVLAEADAAVRTDYRARFAAGWQDAHDDAMTRLYNFFALPPVQAAFCTEARVVLAEAVLASPDAFVASAPFALARLEAPFTAFYDRYAGYRLALAEWRAGATPSVPRLEVTASILSGGTGVLAPR